MGLLEIKLKEKDQELKLSELKYKELKKQIPNTRLRPMRQRTVNSNHTIDRESAYSYERKRNFLTNRPSMPDNSASKKRIKDRKMTHQTVTSRTLATAKSVSQQRLLGKK